MALAACAETGAPYRVGAPPYNGKWRVGEKQEAREHGLSSRIEGRTAGLDGVQLVVARLLVMAGLARSCRPGSAVEELVR